MLFVKPMLLAVMLMSLTPTLSACVTMTGSVETRKVACEAFRPISWSVNDTDQTIREAKAHNAVYTRLCY